uniref:Uncharacterized protein n=1 Tax=Anopheles christyi TaxID=43041 RepID=A0A182KCZ4_9DIPT
MKLCWISLTLTLAASSVCAENILFLQTTPSKSHHIWNRQLFERLYENGHNLTILSFEQETSVPGKTFLVMADYYAKMMAAFADSVGDFSSYEHTFGNIMNVYRYYQVSSDLLEQEDAIQRLLAYPRTFRFDLVIHDFTMGQFLLGFLEHFTHSPLLVSISPYNIPAYTQYLADIPLYTTYQPHPASSYGARMSFTERVRNTIYWWFDMLYRQQVYMPQEQQRMLRVFAGSNRTHVKLLERRSELVLVNSDPALDFYQLLPPNVVQVGGLHVKRAEEMPAMMSQFIARANKGVVLFSFGTNVQSEMLGTEVNRQLLELFSSMPDYGFIWKHANADGLIMPPNLLERRSELVLVNSDPALDFYQLLPPNVVQVGGLHVKRAEEMPAMMSQFIARASKGVVLFSFGTNVQSEMLGTEVNRQLLELFSSMPDYGFIWKHANADGLIMPPNVLMTSWVPQSAVLANGRTRLLVSHGGLLSLQEAAWYGVPVIGVPFFADQFSNVRRIELAGIGIGIPSTQLNAETLKQAMVTILNDASYRARGKELSYLFRTQPEPPLERAIFWIEKVIAGKGLRYLRSPTRSMAPYQVYGLDMVAVVLLIVLGYYLIFKRHSKRGDETGEVKPKSE